MPARPNVVQILEDYIKYFGLNELSILNRKRLELEQETIRPRSFVLPKMGYLIPKKCIMGLTNSRISAAKAKGMSLSAIVEEKVRDELSPLLQEVLTMKEVVDGVRIMFDFLVHQILLYSKERAHFEKCKSEKPHLPYDSM
jgi:hypothetical protein